MAFGNGILVGWNRAVGGKERQAAELFGEFQQYLGKLKEQGTITGHQNVMLAAHGGDLNGFVLVAGDPAKLSELARNPKFVEFVTRGIVNLQGFGAIQCTSGDGVNELMQLYTKHI